MFSFFRISGSPVSAVSVKRFKNYNLKYSLLFTNKVCVGLLEKKNEI